MIPTSPPPTYVPGTRVLVVQHVRVGSNQWRTQITGVVEAESRRPVGGMEMGGKGLYCMQPTLRIRRDDGEITVLAIDENTEVRPVESSL